MKLVLLSGVLACTGWLATAQGETTDRDEGRIAALEQEVAQLKRAARFDQAKLRKEVDDLRIEMRSRGHVKYSKITYRSTDGLSIPAYLFEPLQAGSYPAIIYVHGGQHGTFSSRRLPRIMDWVQTGYVILAPDYRSSSGYSEEFYNKADYGGKEIDDMVAAVDYLETLPTVVRGRIGITGGSHGGYNSLMAVIRYPERFRVAVDLFGPTDLLYRLRSSPEQNTNTDAGDVAYFAKMVGKTIDEAPHLYEQRSPRYLADRIKVPLLILHGDQDQVVNVRESLWLVEALEKAGNTQFEYEIIEGANHGWPVTVWEAGHRRAKEFLDRYLQQ